MARKPTEFLNFPSLIDPGFGPYRAVIKHVTDGDTVDLMVDVGFNDYKYITVRIYGINAPEIFSGTAEERQRGQAARDYLMHLAPPGTPCVIRTDKDRQSFGRYSAKIQLRDGSDVGTTMIDKGHAIASSW